MTFARTLSWRPPAWTLAFALAGALSAAAAAQPKNAAELFVDRGDTFVRAGTAQGLKVGAALTVLGPKIGDTEERRRVGTATVLEVWESLARVSLDADAAKEPGAKLVELSKPGGPKVKAAAAGEAAPSAPAGQPGEDGKKGLKGSAKAQGPRLVVSNEGEGAWSNCELRLPSNKRYLLKALAAHESESVMAWRFAQDGVPRDLPNDWIHVKCDQGERRFSLK